MSAGGATPPRETFADQALAALLDAYARGNSWPEAVRAAITSLFDFLAGEPDRTTACIVDLCGATPDAFAERDRMLDRFVELLRPGFAAAASPPPPVVAEAIAGGIYELVRSHALEQRLEQLPEAVPDATVVALAPFVGSDDAAMLARA